MKKYIIIIISVLWVFSCKEIDPTKDINNPNLLLNNVIGKPGSTKSWLVGQKRQMAIMYNGLLDIAELGSDNYINISTYFNQNFDKLDFSFQDSDVNDVAFRIHDLRESAKVGLSRVFPKDPDAAPSQKVELLFYSGWAKMLAGELFVALPSQEAGTPKTPAENLQDAIKDFLEAEKIDGKNVSIKLALARTYHKLGDKENAVKKANEAINGSKIFKREVNFDGANGPTNILADALFDRGSFDDYQPLPRLDFLDPKYFTIGSKESSVYIQKIEEAYMILAEAQLADNKLAEAKTSMKNLLRVVSTRETVQLDDRVEDRKNGKKDRPHGPNIEVRASAKDTFKKDLVLTRWTPVFDPKDPKKIIKKNKSLITAYVISGTSVKATDIDNAPDVPKTLEMLYLMRQEVFISEGRRFTDLGLKMPISEKEKLTNSKVIGTHVKSFVPSFVPADMDAFTYDIKDPKNKKVTIKYNMNAVLVTNRTNKDVIPFFK